MYESFFGLTEKPFSLLPDPSYLYMGKKHSMALAMLQYGISTQAGFSVLAGEIGSGKTTLIRHLLDRMGSQTTIGLINNTHESFGELLQWVLLAFGLEYKNKEKVELYQTFMDFLIEEYAQNRRTVLIIDEAQNLSADTLEELRMLSNINADKNQVLQLILVGQPELRDVLRKPGLKQFAQRVSVAFYLESLSESETRNYIEYRLAKAGGHKDLFDEKAIKYVHHYSEGIPRVINSLCDTCLVYAYAEEKHRVDEDTTKEVIKDKIKGGLFSPDHEPA